MESILALFLLSPKAIQPIENKYIRYLLYVLVFTLMLFTSVTPLKELIITNGKIHLDVTALRKTSFYILFLLGLIFQFYISLERKIDVKNILVQSVLLSWFMFLGSNLIFLAMGYLVIQIVNFSIVKKNNIEIFTTITLVIFTFMYNNKLFGSWSGYVYTLNFLALMGFFFSVQKISRDKFILNEFILILINLVMLKSYVSITQLESNIILYGLIAMPLLYNSNKIELYTKLLIYSIGLCMIKGDFNIYLITPLFILIYLVKGVEFKVKENKTSLICYILTVTLFVIPILFENSIIQFSNHLWILVIILTLLISEIGRNIMQRGIDCNDKTLHCIFMLIISSALAGALL